MSILTPLAVAEAADRLAGVAHVTPVLTSRGLDERAGVEVFLKCESFQRCGAFKFRGAYNALSCLGPGHKEKGVVTHSSGNHGQALALAAKLLGIPAVVVMPEDASAVKREAALAYGARVVSCAPDGREATADALVAEHGYTLVHPYDDDAVIAGQGTAAKELFEQVGELDLLLVPVGGGGLISGSALAASTLSPGCRVVGIEPERAADAGRSFREGRIHTLESVPDTIADGLRTRHIGERNLAIMRRYVSDMTAVSEEAILEATLFIWQRLKIVVEPSAAAAVVPLLAGRFRSAGKKAGVIVSGGNVDPKTLVRLGAGTSTAGPGEAH